MEGISAIINTFNEADLLEDCIKSIKGFADEIIVGDMMSIDQSAEIARRMGCMVISYPPQQIVEQTFLTRLYKTSNEWILMFDPDNRLPEITAARLKDIVKNNEADVVQFYYRTKIFGKFIKHGHASGGCQARFFKKSILLKNGEPEIKIHSMVYLPLRKNTERWITLDRKYYIEHLAYDNIHKCFEQHLRYARIEADERYNRGDRFNFFKMTYEVLKKIVADFFYRFAWLSGIRGIIYSFIAELMILQIHLFLWDKKRSGN